MPLPTFTYRWSWRLKSPREALWPLIADTDRFNRDTGLPVVEEMGMTGGDDFAGRRLQFRRLGILVEWVEEPFEWIWPERFSVRRRYERGPVRGMNARVRLEPDPDTGGTILFYEVDAWPANPLGLLAIPAQIGLVSRIDFGRIFRRYDRLAAAATAVVAPVDDIVVAPVGEAVVAPVGFDNRALQPRLASSLAPGGKARLEAGVQELRKRGVDQNLGARFAVHLATADPMTLRRIRPYELAAEWSFPRRDLLILCLQAVRAGLLEFQWDLLCPLCRGAKASHEHLDQINTPVHCDACNIDFQAQFEQSVELTFRPSAAIREVPTAAFCVAGPRVTPHILVQHSLDPGGEVELRLDLEPGRYRVRVFRAPGGRYLRVLERGIERGAALLSEPTGATGDSQIEVSRTLLSELARATTALPTWVTTEPPAGATTVSFDGQGWEEDELELGRGNRLLLRNDSARRYLFIVERLAWHDDALTAAEVTALQVFRDLFSREALRPGEAITVGTMTIAFTDLKGSTKMYRMIGDAPAFGRVMDHFAIIRAAVIAWDGAIIKTIGDAVMATFRTPETAFRAMLAAQRELAEGEAGLLLKVGIHVGPCIAVTLNDRLDYFGSTVNLAARLVDKSDGRDIVLSDAALSDPGVRELLADYDRGYDLQPLDVEFRGFEGERLPAWRLNPRDPASV